MASRQFPVFLQFRAMQCGPLHEETQDAWREVAGKDTQGADFNLDPVASVSRMKMRRSVIAIEHRHDNAKETGDFRHAE